MRRYSLRTRMLLGMFGYLLLLTIAVGIHGQVINEFAEHMVWRQLLNAELEHFLERRRSDPDYRWIDSRAIAILDGSAGHPIPPALQALGPGLHDDIEMDGSIRAVLVREFDGKPLVVSLDISAMEEREVDMTLTIAGSAITLMVLLALAVAWSVNRIMRPLSHVAEQIGRLGPDQASRGVDVPDDASTEVLVIADALNAYVERNRQFVERERAFIDSTSHELRTPVAVIAGAAELALSRADASDVARHQLVRIQRTARDVEQLISLLLVLAKDPARLTGASERFALDELLPEIVDDHRHLARDKDLAFVVGPLQRCDIIAPLPIVQAAIGNLLRNAIENSDRGRIVIQLQAPGTVIIDDPGHGMTPEEISAIYAKLARSDSDRAGGGIGLDLIARLCDHLGWSLEIISRPQEGTRTVLTLRTA
ncbi:HAMP domain-containing sensor histidine kinase [Lysobacter fragariae]